MEGRYLALLRGLNVGRGNRLAMKELRAVTTACGYREVGTVLASGNVVFTAPAGVARALARLEPLTAQDWAPAALAVTPRAAWLWCPHGVLKDPLFAEVRKVMGEDLTTRNWATMLKLPALLAGGN